MKEIIVSPSLLAADFTKLGEELMKFEHEHVEWLHYDVMDGHFVPNISFGPSILKSISQKFPHLFYDVHLMISDPKKYYLEFIKSGARMITIHYEAVIENELLPLFKEIKDAGVGVGLSIKPGTDISEIINYLPVLDLVLIMSVEPGFGGQHFIPGALNKIAKLRSYIDTHSLTTLIEVDGGINDVTGAQCVASGVDVLVAGSYLFNEKFAERVKLLRGVK